MRVIIKDNSGNSTGFHAMSVKQAGERLTQVEGNIEIEIENFPHLSHMFPLLFNSEAELMHLIEYHRHWNRQLEEG
tara:strand:+ start:907 stop:1134 length:228 start_codon:yes stop_codon:yes gene_type:complete